jgi:hypothetical protein
MADELLFHSPALLFEQKAAESNLPSGKNQGLYLLRSFALEFRQLRPDLLQ